MNKKYNNILYYIIFILSIFFITFTKFRLYGIMNYEKIINELILYTFMLFPIEYIILKKILFEKIIDSYRNYYITIKFGELILFLQIFIFDLEIFSFKQILLLKLLNILLLFFQYNLFKFDIIKINMYNSILYILLIIITSRYAYELGSYLRGLEVTMMFLGLFVIENLININFSKIKNIILYMFLLIILVYIFMFTKIKDYFNFVLLNENNIKNLIILLTISIFYLLYINLIFNKDKRSL